MPAAFQRLKINAARMPILGANEAPGRERPLLRPDPAVGVASATARRLTWRIGWLHSWPCWRCPDSG
jgi:hypothetical protein